MKMRKCFWMALTAMSVLFTGCNNEDAEVVTPGGQAYMTVSLSGSSARSVSAFNEAAIKDYMVYVFNENSNKLEASAEGELDETKTTTLSVVAGTSKKIVVLANIGMDNYPANVTTYSDLAGIVISLDAQEPEEAKENGLVMTGEKSGVVPVPNQTNQVTVKLERAVAKVTLGSITITEVETPEGEEELDISLLKLLGVSVQRVSPEVTLLPFSWEWAEGSNYYGGLETIDERSEPRGYLADAFGAELESLEYRTYPFNNYFLVFPNQNAAHCTLLSIKAEYDGNILYYPIKINYRAGVEGETNVEGTFIERNTSYTLNLNLKNFAEGSEDPGIPKEEVSLDVTVEVEPWALVIQNEEW